MNLHDILKVSKKKIENKTIEFGKAEIVAGDRPYQEKKFKANGRQTDDKAQDTKDNLISQLKEETNSRQTDDKAQDTKDNLIFQVKEETNGRQTGDETQDTKDDLISQLKEETNSRQTDDETQDTKDNLIFQVKEETNGRQTDDNCKLSTDHILLAISAENYLEKPKISDSKKSLMRKKILKIDSNDGSQRSTGISNKLLKVKLENENVEIFLSGNEKTVYEFIQGLANKSTRSTPPLTKNDFLNSNILNESCIKKTLTRLMDKRLIGIERSHTGRSGWRIFKMLGVSVNSLN